MCDIAHVALTFCFRLLSFYIYIWCFIIITRLLISRVGITNCNAVGFVTGTALQSFGLIFDMHERYSIVSKFANSLGSIFNVSQSISNLLKWLKLLKPLQGPLKCYRQKDCCSKNVFKWRLKDCKSKSHNHCVHCSATAISSSLHMYKKAIRVGASSQKADFIIHSSDWFPVTWWMILVVEYSLSVFFCNFLRHVHRDSIISNTVPFLLDDCDFL